MESPNSERRRPSFAQWIERAREEQPPDIDVRFDVRRALLTEIRRVGAADWMAVLIRLFT